MINAPKRSSMMKITSIKSRNANLATTLFDSRKARVPVTYLLEEKRLNGLDRMKLPGPAYPLAPRDTDPEDDEDPRPENGADSDDVNPEKGLW